MQYHPDKTKGNELAADKFREVTEAYEVLGNHRLRKLYDKGIIHTAGEKYAERPTPPEDDNDPTTKFYRARNKRDHKTANTQIYDFDEWTNAHYGNQFQRQQKLKQTYKEKVLKKETANDSAIHQHFVFVIVLLVVIMVSFQHQSKDVDLVSKNKSPKNS